MPLHLSSSLTQPHTHSLRGQLWGRIWSTWAEHFTFAENNTKSPLCVCVCHIIPQRHLSGVSGQQMKHVIDLQCEVWPRCSCSLIDNGSVLMCVSLGAQFNSTLSKIIWNSNEVHLYAKRPQWNQGRPIKSRVQMLLIKWINWVCNAG